MSEPTPAQEFQAWVNDRAEQKATEAAETRQERHKRIQAEFAAAVTNHF